MANRSILAAAILALAQLTMVPSAFGLEAVPGTNRDDAKTSEGIRTDRLTPKQRRIWESIEQVIQAVDGTGRPLHPRLFSLWRWAQTSSHPIYIEIVGEKHTVTYNAGFLTIQGEETDGAPKSALIQLWSWVIENASVQEGVRRSDGFIPFKGLGAVERYVQVLGHELAHAKLQFEDPAYDQLCRQLESERAAFLSSARRDRMGNTYDEPTQQRLARLRSLTDRIEKPAQSTEVEIWSELLQGQKAAANRPR